MDDIKESLQALIPLAVAHRLSFLRRLPAGTSSSVHFGRELPDVSCRQEVHHRLVAFLYGVQLRDCHVSASAHPPSHCFSHLFPEHLLLVFPSAAVAEKMLPHLGYRPASATAPTAFVVVSVSELFLVRPHWRMSGLQLVEQGC